MIRSGSFAPFSGELPSLSSCPPPHYTSSQQPSDPDAAAAAEPELNLSEEQLEERRLVKEMVRLGSTGNSSGILKFLHENPAAEKLLFVKNGEKGPSAVEAAMQAVDQEGIESHALGVLWSYYWTVQSSKKKAEIKEKLTQKWNWDNEHQASIFSTVSNAVIEAEFAKHISNNPDLIAPPKSVVFAAAGRPGSGKSSFLDILNYVHSFSGNRYLPLDRAQGGAHGSIFFHQLNLGKGRFVCYDTVGLSDSVTISSSLVKRLTFGDFPSKVIPKSYGKKQTWSQVNCFLLVVSAEMEATWDSFVRLIESIRDKDTNTAIIPVVALMTHSSSEKAPRLRNRLNEVLPAGNLFEMENDFHEKKTLTIDQAITCIELSIAMIHQFAKNPLQRDPKEVKMKKMGFYLEDCKDQGAEMVEWLKRGQVGNVLLLILLIVIVVALTKWVDS